MVSLFSVIEYRYEVVAHGGDWGIDDPEELRRQLNEHGKEGYKVVAVSRNGCQTFLILSKGVYVEKNRTK